MNNKVQLVAIIIIIVVVIMMVIQVTIVKTIIIIHVLNEWIRTIHMVIIISLQKPTNLNLKII
jgi:hypothetical protein